MNCRSEWRDASKVSHLAVTNSTFTCDPPNAFSISALFSPIFCLSSLSYVDIYSTLLGVFASSQKLPEEQLEEEEYDMNNEEKKMNENECEVFNNNEDDILTMMSEDFQ